MNVEIFGETNSTSIIVLLPGLGVSSPIYDFKPLAEELSKNYKIVVIEPFGYGLSDLVEEERTLENVSSEIHTAIKELGIEKYYLAASSLSGLYSLKIANDYPEELLGFIGIDITVPGQEVINNIFLNITESSIVRFIFLGIKEFDRLGITGLFDKYKPNALSVFDKNYKLH